MFLVEQPGDPAVVLVEGDDGLGEEHDIGVPLHQLILQRDELDLLDEVHLLADPALGVGAEIASVLDEEGVIADHGHRPRVVVHVFHALDVLDHHEVACLETVRRTGCHSSPFLVGDIADADLRKLYARVEHLPLLSEISGEQPEEAELNGEHDHCLRVLLRAYELINGHDSSDIIDIAKDNNVVLQAFLLRYFGIELIHVNFVIEPMAQLYQVVSPGLLAHVILAVV